MALGIVSFTPAHAHWTETGMPEGGPVCSFVMSQNMLFAATFGGVFRFNNNSARWEESFTECGGYTLAANGTNIFYGTNNNGIYVSSDSGKNWNAASDGLPKSISVNCLLAKGTQIFAGTPTSGVFVSDNNGASWSQIDTAQSGLTLISTLAENGSHIFAGSYNGDIFKSDDNGVSWSAIYDGINQNRLVTALAANGDTIIAAVFDSVFLSIDLGNQWTHVLTALSQMVTCIIMNGSTIFAGTSDGRILRSTNMGTDWTTVFSDSINYDMLSLYTFGSELYAGSQKGAFRSVDTGTTWTAFNAGLTIAQGFLRFLWSTGSIQFMGTYGCGFHRSSDYGSTWTWIEPVIPHYYLYSPDRFARIGNNLFLAINSYIGVARSTDNGCNWTEITSGKIGDYAIKSIAATSKNLYAATVADSIFTFFLFRANESGTGWTKVTSGNYNQNLRFIAASRTNLFASMAGDGLYVLAPDSSGDWLRIDAGLPVQCEVTKFVENGTDIFIGIDIGQYGGGFYYSADGGMSWTQKNTGLANEPRIRSIAANDDYVFTLATDTAYFSMDKGTNWYKLPCEGLPPDSPLTTLTLSDTYLFGRVYPGTLWRMPLSNLTTQIGQPQPSEVTFLKVSMSTCSDSRITIVFSLPCTELVSIAMYNLSGTKIASLPMRKFASGTHRLHWDIKNLAAGHYTVRMQAGTHHHTKSIVIMN